LRYIELRLPVILLQFMKFMCNKERNCLFQYRFIQWIQVKFIKRFIEFYDRPNTVSDVTNHRLVDFSHLNTLCWQVSNPRIQQFWIDLLVVFYKNIV